MLYKLSRFSLVHRALRKVAYSVLWTTPRWIKEPLLHAYLGGRLPYSAVSAGDTVIQIGAPWDILKSGRSRFIHFLRKVGPKGRVIVVEPDAHNVKCLREYVASHGINNLTIVPKGAWNSKTTLRFLVDPENPASNLVEDVLDSKRTDCGRFNVSEIEVDTLDNIIHESNSGDVRLVSITTNGSENQILAGMVKVQEKLLYIATIGEASDYPALLSYGYAEFGGDDRGYTFKKNLQ